MGEYMIKAASLAVEEVNAAGGVLGRELRLLPEDDMNPGVAVQKATKLIQQEKVDALLGTVSSAVCLAVMDVADRAKVLLVNTGSNSDEIRGKRCNYYTFSVEGSNSQYVNTIGRYLIKEKQYKRWYFLTSDYAFGHDLLRVSRGLLKKMGGTEVGSELIPTGTVDFSSYLLKVKSGKPDVVFQNLAGTDQTNFMKQYAEFGMTTEVAGGLIDTLLMWPVGAGAITGSFPLLWWYDLPYEGSKRFSASFIKKYGKPPENQAWGDYIGVKAIALAMQQAGTTDSKKVVEAMEKIKFDGGQGARSVFPTLGPPVDAAHVGRPRKEEERGEGSVGHLEDRRRGPGQE